MTSLNANAIVLTQEQFSELKESLRSELFVQMSEQIRNEVKQEIDQKGITSYYVVIKGLVNDRFTRVDLGHRINPEAVRAFTSMVKDAFKLQRIYDLTPEQGQKAVAMVKELFAVVDKYTIPKKEETL